MTAHRQNAHIMLSNDCIFRISKLKNHLQEMTEQERFMNSHSEMLSW